MIKPSESNIWRPQNKLKWDEIVLSIQNDDIEQFKKFNLPSANINLPISHDIKLIAKHGSTVLPYFCPESALVLSFIILCRAGYVFDYVNKKLYPKYDNLYNGLAPIHHLAMVPDTTMIRTALETESAQRSLTTFTELRFSGTVHRSSVLHIAVTHKNIHMVYHMLSPLPEIQRTLPRRVDEEIKKVDIRAKSSHGSTSLDIAIQQQDVTMTLLLLSFYKQKSQGLQQWEKEELLKKCSPQIECDAVTSQKMKAITTILNEPNIPEPDELYQNYINDQYHYERIYNPNSILLQTPEVVNIPVPSRTCWCCPKSDSLVQCPQCKRNYCPVCFVKSIHDCKK